MPKEREQISLQPRSDSSSRPFPSVPESVRRLRSSSNQLYVEKLICFLRTRAESCHPSSDVGWWCQYEEQMRDLVTFLSEPAANLRQLWNYFREEVARQLSFCRQCTFAYHKAVKEWELSNEVSGWSKEVIRKRVSNLVEWDALRLTPSLERGVECTRSSDGPNSNTSRTQCREAFLDATLSMRLCMDTAFCAVLGKVVRARFVIPAREEFTGFIMGYGMIPPGLAALCFHRCAEVRSWAKSVYVTSPPHLQVDEQVLQLLISKNLRLAVDKSLIGAEGSRSRRAIYTPDLQSIWEGVNALIRRMSSSSLRTTMKKWKRFPIVDAVYKMLLTVRGMPIHGVPPGFSESLRSLQCFLRVEAFPSLLRSCELTPQEFLDAISDCLNNRSLGQNERLLLLDVIMDIPLSSVKRDSISDTRCLFLQCFNCLGYLRRPEECDTDEILKSKPTRKDRHKDSCADILGKGTILVNRFYWHFWPKLPLDDQERLAEFITTVVRILPDRDCTWDLLHSALITDVCNLFLCIYEPHEVQNIFGSFFSSSTEMGEEEKERTIPLQDGVRKILATSKGKPPVFFRRMEELWRNVATAAHISEEHKDSQKIRKFDARLALDLHRLVGVLDPQRCGDMIKENIPDSNPPGTSIGVDYGLISRRFKTIFDTILARLQLSRHLITVDVSLHDLSRQAWHLLTSSDGNISKDVHVALLKKCEIQNATFARPQSRDKVLSHILKQNEKDCLMVCEGFKSVSRMICAHSRAVSARTYACFFRWYSLLASRDCRILWDTTIFMETFRILLNFLDTLDNFEATMTSQAFLETVCRVYSTIPTIWDSFSEYERTTYDGSTGPSRRSPGNDPVLVQKVGMKLLTSCSMRDKLALDAWVRMVTQKPVRSALNGIEASRDILLRILRKNVGRQGPLDFEQCSRLADAYSLHEASSFLGDWSANEAGRPQRQQGRAATVKLYRDERVAGCSSVRRTDTYNSTGHRTRKKPTLHSISAASTRHKGYLHDLRKDHRQARADLRRAAGECGPAWGSREPPKTRFELIREERIAQKQRERFDSNHDMSSVHRLESQSKDCYAQDLVTPSLNDSFKPGSHFRNPLGKSKSQSICYPLPSRNLASRNIEQVKRAVLIPDDPQCLRAELYTGAAPHTFRNVESYVSYWEPLLIAEFRAAIRRKTDEQRFLVVQDGMGSRNPDSGRSFEVDGPAEDIGYIHTLSISCHNQNMESLLGEPDMRVTKAFDVSKEQKSDVLLLEISEAGQLRPNTRNGGPEVITAIVSNVLRTRKKTQLSLHLVFGGLVAPGKGRKVRVRKLLSFTTLHRQLKALWALPKAQDGILWSLMDPAVAWRTKRDLEAREDYQVDRNSSLPMLIVEKVEKLGMLNASQCKAVADVIRSCHCLFATPNRIQGSHCQNGSNSGVSLIQGPPGTGKTSTIITLLSALLSRIGSQPLIRKTRVVEGISVTTTNPAIRILVCAPSNAAVDEIMTRVVDEGLVTLSGYQICPRIVRVGQGTTVKALQALEAHSVAKSLRKEPPFQESATIPSFPEVDHQELVKVKKQIGKLEVALRRISIQNDAESGVTGSLSSALPMTSEKLKHINEKLHILQDKKNQLYSVLKNKRETRKSEGNSRKQEDMRAVLEALSAASIVFATLNSSGHEDLKSLGAGFDVVIIDEAGQSCEPETLIPMSIGQHMGSTEHRFIHTVLVGDPKQLPPTILSSNHQVATALGRSLFERIANVDSGAVHLLDTQYRMHPELSLFPSLRFYDGLLRNGARVRDKSMHRNWHFDPKKRFGPLTLFDTTNTSGKEARSRIGSLSNEVEAKFVIQAILSILRLYQSERLVQSIVALSPYKQQVQLLKKLISQNEELHDANVEASTIDGIQGREKSVVLLSTVRSGHSSDIGFVKDERRLNVALTRAKHSLLIFGHAEFLSEHSEAWAALVSHCHERSQIISLAGAQNAIFRDSRGVVQSWIPQALPKVDEVPYNDDKNTEGVSLSRNVMTGTESFRYEKGLEKSDVLEERVVVRTSPVTKTRIPKLPVTKRDHDVVKREGVQDGPALYNFAMEDSVGRRPPHGKSDDAFTTTLGRGFGSIAKRRKLVERSTSRTVQRCVAENAGTSVSTESRKGDSNLPVLTRGRSRPRDKANTAGSSPSSRARQQVRSAQADGGIQVSQRLSRRAVRAGRGNADQDQSRALVPTKRPHSSLNISPSYNAATISKIPRAGSSTKLERCHIRTYSVVGSLKEQRMGSTHQPKHRIFQNSLRFQNRRQANPRLSQHHNAKQEKNGRSDRFSIPDDKRCAQGDARHNTVMSSFSLVESRAKLKLTLEAVRKAKQ